MADANWFFSSCAQTAGAIVAIVGGFLVTRLVSLSAERNGLQQALARAERRVGAAAERRKSVEAEVHTREREAFRRAIVDELADAAGEYDVDLLAEQHYACPLERPEMEKIADEVAAAVQRAAQAMSAMDPRDIADAQFEDVALALRDQMPPQDRDVYRSVFANVRSAARERVWSPLQRATHPVYEDLVSRPEST